MGRLTKKPETERREGKGTTIGKQAWCGGKKWSGGRAKRIVRDERSTSTQIEAKGAGNRGV